jgi:thiamine-phosphate pyrophosphorylase
VIIDRNTVKGRNISKIAEDALRGGADIIQLRDKSSEDTSLLESAKAIKDIAKKYRRLFIVNDRADIAAAAGADGVHLGQGDLPIGEARKVLGRKIIGISTHSLKQARKAERDGADYVGIGPIFKTKTKKGLSPIGSSILRSVSRAIDIPFFAIGGISCNNITDVKKTGTGRIAVVSSAIKRKNVYESVKRLKKAIDDAA